jgi:hypothetical protein
MDAANTTIAITTISALVQPSAGVETPCQHVFGRPFKCVRWSQDAKAHSRKVWDAGSVG